MNKELIEAIEILGKEKNISKQSLLDAIENSLMSACKNNFGTSDNVTVSIDPDTCEYTVIQSKTVVEALDDPKDIIEKATKISLVDAKMIDPEYELGDTVQFNVQSKEFGRIATGVAKNVILQKIREEERKVVYNDYFTKEREIVTGVVQRTIDKTSIVDEPFHATYENAMQAINVLRDKFGGSALFAHEKDESFHSSIGQIYQTFDGVELYPSIEEKAAMLLYLVVKNHSFSDGNKRIAAMLFLWFLDSNHILYAPDGHKRIADNTLVALTLMIAESRPDEKDVMVKVVVNLINQNNE